MNSVKLLTAVGVSVCALGFAVAQPGLGQVRAGGIGPGGPGGPDGPRGERMGLFERFDANGDGLISRDEVDAAKAQREERRAERAQRMASRALERFDTNEDGALDEGELAAMFERGPRHRDGGPVGHAGPHGKMGRAARVLGQEAMLEFDADGDGAMSREEMHDARDEIRAKLEAKRDEMTAPFDLDGDGELSASERETMRTELRATRRIGRADIDRDGTLDAGELDRVLRLIGDEDPSADFNGDGVVNQADYETLVKLLPGA